MEAAVAEGVTKGAGMGVSVMDGTDVKVGVGIRGVAVALAGATGVDAALQDARTKGASRLNAIRLKNIIFFISI